MPSATARFTELSVLLEKRFHVARVSVMPSTPLNDLGLDSLAMLTFVCAAENAFQSRIPATRLNPAGPDGPLTLQGLCELLGAGSEVGSPG
ncbi:acyl carrier protein [Variovorax boronicumulans]|uniref:acyl carrier protein n=1 Tax=Variovorax boronicumulans TaxID=436515 RepID=UPI002474F89C|nr:acyl carrier protein [Variovorax boronicumulans]MDH6165786.1 acyl carrier protein [Variovorax boronicumulans]